MKGSAVLSWVKVALAAGLIPLWFVKFYHSVGHLPGAENPDQIVEMHFYHSMFENARDSGLLFAVILSIGLLAASAVVTLIHLRKPSLVRVRKAHSILFWIAISLFILMLLYGFTVGRGY